jgi:hypothetical protein
LFSHHLFHLALDRLTTDIEVIITATGAIGVIEAVENATTCRVRVYETKELVSAQIRSISAVPPEKKDIVKIMQGEFIDQIGSLIAIDGKFLVCV